MRVKWMSKSNVIVVKVSVVTCVEKSPGATTQSFQNCWLNRCSVSLRK